jgi:HSP20 family molecular chaperone IbpA
VTLQTDVKAGTIAAPYRHGVLEGHVPKAAEAKTTRREISMQ